MAIPVSSSITQIPASSLFQEGFELSLDAIVPSVELTGSFLPFKSKMEFFIYDYSKTLLYSDLDYDINGSYILAPVGTSTSITTSSYNQVQLTPIDDVYNQGYSNGEYFAVYNFVNYELGSELSFIKETETETTNYFTGRDGEVTLDNTVTENSSTANYNGHPYFIKDISGDRTELRLQNNFLNVTQIQNYYNEFTTKLNSRNDADEFYVAFGENRNFIAVNSQLELPISGSSLAPSILIKLYKPLPSEYVVEQQVQIISKVAETQAYEIEFNPNLKFVDSLLSLKGPNFNIDLKDRVNNSTNYKNLNDLINANSSQSYFQFNSLQDETGVILRKDYGDWSQFVKYSSAEQRLNNFYDKMVSIEAFEAEILELDTISGGTELTDTFSSSYSEANNKINDIISKFDSYEYYLYYITGSNSWPKYDSTYPYPNYSVSSSALKNWFGTTNEIGQYYNTGKNQIYSASRYDNDNQDYLYYIIPPFITENSNNNQYIKFVSMVGQTFDEMYLYTEAVEQVRNTNSPLTGSVLPLQMADEVIESFGFNTYANSFNSIGFNPNQIGVFPAVGSGEEYINRYIDITSGSVINYYDQNQTTLGYIINLADPAFPYPLENAAQEIYKRIFHNMVSLVKRKGTVTGLRQLINIWGVPNTMLRISEFGGKNKDDENDYDLWMNRYSTAVTTYPRTPYTAALSTPTSSVRIPWQPLTANYYATGSTPVTSTEYYAVPDCIQFRFKVDEQVTPTSNFSQSLLVKGNLNDGTADFAVTLAYSGSNSGSFNGSQLPTTSKYGNLTFHLSGSIANGGVKTTTPISLPFFDGNWWSVQLQRLTHLSASNQDSTAVTYQLKTANNIYEGYDGNQIGFQGTETLLISAIQPSYNAAWNDIHGVTTFNPAGNSYVKGYSALVLGGMMDNGVNNDNIFIGTGTNSVNIGSGFSGSFQEFRYYRRALSSSQFNDYVMNPESIQGHADSNTGLGSSYDLLSFRLPLGNELEYNNVSGSANYTTFTNAQGGLMAALNFGGNSTFAGKGALGSLHPSLVNKLGTLYTSSFITTLNATSSQYSIAYQGRNGLYNKAISSSFLAPNNEINYMDQPAAGIRNRIKNKIQVIDGNEYGTILSPFRSIQQEFEQSSSYTEDLNSLEVGFSFQNEINDDIIATFGHGVVSDAIADPRFISESSDRYPELTRIAEDYFKKYQGVTFDDPTYTGLPTIIEKEYDYNRLIKFYETSLFKAIKNYVPARTSLSTGIIVKQHLLERNKTDAVIAMNLDTVIAITPETGSVDGVPESQIDGGDPYAGYNSTIALRNILISGSIPMETLTGSAGGSINKYNNLGVNSQNFSPDLPYLYFQENNNFTITTTFQNILITGGNISQLKQNHFGIFQTEGGGFDAFLSTDAVYNGNLALELAYNSGTLPNTLSLELRSNLRGTIISDTVTINTPSPQKIEVSSNKLFSIFPGEEIRLFVKVSSNTVVLDYNAIAIGNTNLVTPGSSDNVLFNSASQQFYRTLDDFTGETIIKDTQDEFFTGEYSGSNIPTIPSQYNPYRIFLDGTNLNPDDLPGGGSTPPTVNLAAGPYNTSRFTTATANGAVAVPIRATGSLKGDVNVPVISISGSASGGNSSDSMLFRNMGNQTNSARSITITSTDGTERTYLNIGNNSSLMVGGGTSMNGKLLIENVRIDNKATLSVTGTPANGQTTGVIFTRSTPSDALAFEATTEVSSNIVDSITVTNQNAAAVNSTLWVEVGNVFTGTFPAQGGGVVTATITITTAGLTNGLLSVQCTNDGTSGNAALQFKAAVEGSFGHNGKLSVTAFGGCGQQANLVAAIVKETAVGVTTDPAFSSNGEYVSGNGNTADASNVGVCQATDDVQPGGGAYPSDYVFPTRFQGGAAEPAQSTIYLQNAITNLTPGAQYEISFDIKDLSFDNLGNSNQDVGMSSLATPGGSANGVGTGFRGTSAQTITGTWTQAAGQTTAMFFSALGMQSQIQNVQIIFPDDTMAPKHFFSRDAFTIFPTASVLFENSIYNPIINNVTESRASSLFFDQDFDPPTPSYIKGAKPTTLGIPADYSLLVSSSELGFRGTGTADNLLEFAEVPDSNYTQTNVINPRYIGTELFSADYNFYTGIPSESLAIGKSSDTGITGLANPPFLLTQNKVRFVNNETGSWTGDYSYGKTAVIDRNPINIAHFKSSLESKEYFDTTTFNIDQLIQIPFEEILDQQSPIITSSLINGSNENLTAMSSTFMVGREATIIYNQSNKTFNNIGGTVLNYTNLGAGAREINAGGINFSTYSSNELFVNKLSTLQYYDLPLWYDYRVGINQTGNFNTNTNIEITPNSSSLMLSASYVSASGFGPIPNSGSSVPFSSSLYGITGGSDSPSTSSFYSGAPGVIMAYTGSRKDLNGRDVGVLNLRGPVPGAIPSLYTDRRTNGNYRFSGVDGCTLALFNSINTLVKLGDINPAITSSDNVDQPFAIYGDVTLPLLPGTKEILTTRGVEAGPGSLPTLGSTERNNPQSYFRFNLSGSDLLEYRVDNDTSIIVEPGDEIRVQYAYFANPENQTTLNKTYQDFTVLGYDQCAPALMTLTQSKAQLDGNLAPKFDIAVLHNDSISPTVQGSFKSPLPEKGFYSFSNLLDKYKLAKENGDLYTISSTDGFFDMNIASGSISGISTRSVTGSTGIIGLTMSLSSNHSKYLNASCILATSYNQQLQPDYSLWASGNSDSIMYSQASPIVRLGQGVSLPLDPGYLFDRVVVHPDPNTLENPIPKGRIFGLTLRKRKEADDRVVLNAVQPSGSAGALTLSGDGYLIPNDLTDTQQRNVQKIINKLKSENVFTQDSPDTVGGDLNNNVGS
mgnify:CR=1 FL=1|jgi:hypothetical protein